MSLRSLNAARRALFLGVLILMLGLAGCGGSDGNDGKDGAPGEDGRDATVNSTAVGRDEMVATITDVTVASPPVVDFAVTTKPDASIPGTGVSGLTVDQFSFYMAWLNNGSAAGDASRWETYYPASFSSDTGGTFVDNEDGTYQYTFGLDITQEAGYNANATHRLVIEVKDVMAADGEAVIFNPHIDFRPDGGSLNLTRDIAVVQGNCNRCHGVLKYHRGGKDTVETCTMCHAPPGSGQVVKDDDDFKRMIHKIHLNENVDKNLPTMPLGGGTVIHPQDTRNCETCHDQDNPNTPDAQNWFTMPTQEACSACHDGPHCSGADPTVPGPGDSPFCGDPIGLHMANLQNSQCSTCHTPQSSNPADVPGGIPESHVLVDQVAASQYQYNILDINPKPVAPGAAPQVTFSISNPTNPGGANDPDGLGERYDLSGNPISDPALAGAKTNTRMTVAWETAEYTNEGNGRTEAQTLNTAIINGGALAAGIIDNSDRSYTVTLTNVAPGTTTSGAVTMEGRLNAGGDDLAVRTDVKFFAITDNLPQPRRVAVEIGKCNACHQQLALHNASRVDNPQVCVTCHNPNATDLISRPAAGAGSCDPVAGTNVGADGKCEQAIDFKYLIHALHAANITVYSWPTTANDFSDANFPEPQLSNCLACHVEDQYYPDSEGPVLGTTIQSVDYATLTNRRTGADNIRISPFASSCSGCHIPDAERDDPTSANLTKLHMEQNGADFRLVPGEPVQETCDICHGEGQFADIGVVHGLR